MGKLLEGVTLETVSDALRKEGIRPGQRFSITVDGDKPERLAEIAARMRATAAARGMTTEIFDSLIAQPE